MTDLLVLYAPLDGWLCLLAQGWQFCSVVVGPMPGSHGLYSVMLERAA
jgi:hypothetical protein